MNKFDFIGTIVSCKIKSTSTNKKYLSIIMNESNGNSAYLQMYADSIPFDGKIPVYFTDNERHYIPYEDRKNTTIISQVKNMSKYRLVTNIVEDYIWKEDFIFRACEVINSMPENTIYRIIGDFYLSTSNEKLYYNFNIRHIKIENNKTAQFTMDLDLYYNFESLDQKDKANKFILNGYIEQYCSIHSKKEYFPLTTYFITNKFDFKNKIDVEIIRHRRDNMNPDKDIGFVKAKWEAQYLKGATLIVPPLETLPLDAQFEIKYAGRRIEDYASKIVSKADEYICLTRPNNILTEDNKVFTPLQLTDLEFKNNIHQNGFTKSISENRHVSNNQKTIDDIAKEDANNNPFNFK